MMSVAAAAVVAVEEVVLQGRWCEQLWWVKLRQIDISFYSLDQLKPTTVE